MQRQKLAKGMVVTLTHHKETYQGKVTRVFDDGKSGKIEFIDSQQVTQAVWRTAGEVKVVVR